MGLSAAFGRTFQNLRIATCKPRLFSLGRWFSGGSPRLTEHFSGRSTGPIQVTCGETMALLGRRLAVANSLQGVALVQSLGTQWARVHECVQHICVEASAVQAVAWRQLPDPSFLLGL